MDSSRWPAKTGLAGVTMNKVELAPHDDARARFLTLMHNEGTVLEAEVVIYFLK